MTEKFNLCSVGSPEKSWTLPVEHVVSVLHASSHFSVMDVHVANHSVEITDGLNYYDLDTWFSHVENVLKRTQLIPMTSNLQSQDNVAADKWVFFIQGQKEGEDSQVDSLHYV